MGYNTTVFILNDCLSDIERNPEKFVADIARHLNGGTDHALGQTTVMKTAHADVPRLYLTSHNSIIELDEYADRTLDLHERGFEQPVRQAIAIARDKLDRLERHLNGLDMGSQRR